MIGSVWDQHKLNGLAWGQEELFPERWGCLASGLLHFQMLVDVQIF